MRKGNVLNFYYNNKFVMNEFIFGFKFMLSSAVR